MGHACGGAVWSPTEQSAKRTTPLLIGAVRRRVQGNGTTGGGQQAKLFECAR